MDIEDSREQILMSLQLKKVMVIGISI